MIKFGVISEGVTDYWVIDELLYRYFNTLDQEVYVKHLHPQYDETDVFGGWEQLLKFCEGNIISENALENDFLIIQIDTDIIEEKPFKISLNKNLEDIHSETISKIKEFINPKIENHDKIIFALGMHSTECWLLGIIDSSHKNSTVNKCLPKLRFKIRKDGKFKPIGDKGKSKDTYEGITSILKKQKDIIKKSKSNFGFEKFVEQLEQEFNSDK